MINQIKNPTFGGFKPDAMSRIAKSMGYEGNMSDFQQYLDQNPDKRTQMDQFKQAAMMMAKGGSVQKFAPGGMPNPQEEQVEMFNQANQNAAVASTNSNETTTAQSSYTPTQQADTLIRAGQPSPQTTTQVATQVATQVSPEQMAAQQQAQTQANATQQAAMQSQMQEALPLPADIQAQMDQQQQINNAMQEKFGERGKPDDYVPGFLSKMDALKDSMKATTNAFMKSKGIAENDFGAMSRYMQSNPNAQEELEAALQSDQQQTNALTQQLTDNPEYRAFQAEVKQYKQSLEGRIPRDVGEIRGGPALPMPIDPDTGLPPETGGPALPIEPTPEPKPPSSEKLPQLIQTPQGSFNAQARVVTLVDGTTRQEFTIKDSKGKTVATLTGSAELMDWMKQNEATSYDPSQGMPDETAYLEQQDSTIEKLFENPNWNEGTTAVNMDLNADKAWSKSTVKEYATSDAIAENPDNYELVKKGDFYSLVYPDGTEIDTRHKDINYAQGRANALSAAFKAAAPISSNYESQKDTYRKYITEQTTGGVTGDIENIEEEYSKAKSTYKQQELELQRLQAQAEDNPDDPYLKQLVEEKGKEVSDSYSRIQQLEPTFLEGQKTIEDVMTERATDPTLPEGTKIEAEKIGTEPDQFIAEGTGSLEGDISYDAVKGKVTTSEGVEKAEAETYDPTLVTDKAKAELDKVEAVTLDEFSEGVIFEGEQGELSAGAYADEALKVAADRIQKVNEKLDLEVTKQQLAEVKGKNLKAIETKVAKSSALLDAVAAAHVVQPNELPTPQLIAEEDMAQAKAMTDSGLDKDAIPIAAKMASFSVDNGTLAKAAQGDVDSLATVEGQLGKLMKQFDDGTPAWAAGAIRAANATMASRGLGASSMAGAAILQAAMESAMPIAKQDAATYAAMGVKNLDNRQAVAIANAAAQQGLELKNLDNEQKANIQKSINAFGLQTQNLTNRQASEVANAQIRSTLQGQNLSNMQTSNIAEAARYAEAANINLNNKQQAAMQDNSNALKTNLAELSAEQSAYINSANTAAALQGQVLSNDQQVSISNAARYSEAANIEFTAEQQNTLHNSKLMSSIGLAELSASQAATLQNAATVANMDITNLNNRQQAAVQNAKSFLQRDMTNLSNEQQTALFKAQATQQALLSDQAAENASKQFNASSENQTNQFYDNLTQQNNQHNSAQANAMEMANVDAENAALEYNASMKNNREQYEASNELVIAQSNVTWRREVATEDTAAVNRANELNAINTLDISNQAYDNMWNMYGDQMEWTVNGYESEADRVNVLTVETMRQDGTEKAAKYAADSKASSAIGGAVVNLLTADTGIIGDLF